MSYLTADEVQVNCNIQKLNTDQVLLENDKTSIKWQDTEVLSDGWNKSNRSIEKVAIYQILPMAI